jgi:hypothetical protein
MVFPDSEISLKVYASEWDKPSGHYFFDVINQHGDKAISHGYAYLEH